VKAKSSMLIVTKKELKALKFLRLNEDIRLFRQIKAIAQW
jgi:hypothetical protein